MNKQELLNALKPQHTHRVSPINNNTLDSRKQQKRQLKQILFYDQLVQSQNLVDIKNAEVIKSRMKEKQQKVYNSITMDNKQYLQNMFQLMISSHQHKQQDCQMQKIVNEVELAVGNRLSIVQNDLELGNLIIDQNKSIKSKRQLMMLEHIDRARLIKIKQGQIKSKMQLMNEKLFQFDQMEQSQKDIVDNGGKYLDNMPLPENFTLNSQRTQIASQYTKHLSQQRKVQIKRIKQRELQIEKIKEQQTKEQIQAMEKQKKQKHAKLLGQLQGIKQKKQLQQKKKLQLRQRAEKIVGPYLQKPKLFELKEKEFQQKILKPQQKYRQDRLKQLSQRKRLSNPEFLKQHQQKYLINRKIYQQKLEEKKMMQRSLEVRYGQQFYKGKTHQRVVKQDQLQKKRVQSMLQIRKQKRNKMKSFDQVTRQDYVPLIDSSKRDQLSRIIQDQQIKKGRQYKRMYRPISNGQDHGVQIYYEQIPQKNRYQQGNRYMQYGKSKAKKVVQSMNLISQKQIQNHQKKINKLMTTGNYTEGEIDKNIWQLRTKKIQELLKDPKQFQIVKFKLQTMDEMVANKQKLLKLGNYNMQEHINQKSALDQFYLQAIKGKMKMLQM